MNYYQKLKKNVIIFICRGEITLRNNVKCNIKNKIILTLEIKEDIITALCLLIKWIHWLTIYVYYPISLGYWTCVVFHFFKFFKIWNANSYKKKYCESGKLVSNNVLVQKRFLSTFYKKHTYHRKNRTFVVTLKI